MKRIRQALTAVTAGAVAVWQAGRLLTGDAPHRFAAEYPWPYGCWCNKPEDDPVHQAGAGVPL